jgi:glycosyltransferase involved in cell wall biosynthesis
MSEFGDEARHDYAARPMLVAYVGRITEAVGARTMAEAATHLQRAGVRTVLAGPIDPALESELRRTTASADVDFPGWLGRSEVQTLLGTARVGIVLFQPVGNYVEAYPTKLFEYMASGVPVVASDFPLWRQIVESAGCGLLVDPTDSRAVASAIDRLLADPEGSAEMGARGRRAVLAEYQWEGQADRLTDLYTRLLTRSARLASGDGGADAQPNSGASKPA